MKINNKTENKFTYTKWENIEVGQIFQEEFTYSPGVFTRPCIKINNSVTNNCIFLGEVTSTCTALSIGKFVVTPQKDITLSGPFQKINGVYDL